MRFGGEDAHQVVFQRQIETARTGIALTAGTAAQLVVDTAGFVALGADDVQSAGGEHLVLTLLPVRLDRAAMLLEPGLAGFLRGGLDLRLQISAEHDVGTAARHVRGDGHACRACRLAR